MPTRARCVRSEAFMVDALREHGPAVWRLALVRTGARADAEDVYQDVFVRLATDATEFADGEHLKAWLLRTTVNRCRDVARMRSRRRTVTLDEVPFEPADPAGGAEDQLVGADERARLAAAVGRLPVKLREAIHLCYGEGMSSEQAAQVLGVRPSAVRMRVKRACERLRGELGGADGPSCGEAPGCGTGATDGTGGCDADAGRRRLSPCMGRL